MAKNRFWFSKNNRFNKNPRTFKIIRKISDMDMNAYILKFVYEDNTKEVFFLMYSEFKESIHSGRISFSV